MVCVIRVKKCCCGCVSLRNGTIAIGVFYLVVAVLGAACGFGYKSVADYDFGLYNERYFLLLFGISCVVCASVNMTLLEGAVMKRAELLVPWLVWHMALPFLSLINLLWSCVTLFYGLPLLITKPAIIVAVFILLVNGLLVYFSIVVYSFYRDLKESTFDVMASAPSHTTTTGQTAFPLSPCTMHYNIATAPHEANSLFSQGNTRHHPALQR